MAHWAVSHLAKLLAETAVNWNAPRERKVQPNPSLLGATFVWPVVGVTATQAIHQCLRQSGEAAK